ncbi:unnamed protein product [Nezara viridula]|uniref:Carboxylesterase type B domain-containing protein n=1 Tax=Nezara viridula TaxID=85310 RepID=A0A9P0HB87_NEZVI|nr:unnamed protein product [Nezara viridula]
MDQDIVIVDTNYRLGPFGLFSGAIAQSGSSYNVWSVSPPGVARARAKRLASLMSCPLKDTKQVVACLSRKDPTDIIKQLRYFLQWQVDPMITFQPSLEPAGPEAFLTGPIKKWKHAPVPLLLGLNSAEGFVRTRYFLKMKMDFKWLSDYFDNVAALSIDYVHSAINPIEVTKKIKKFYFSDGVITESNWENVTNLYSDAWFTAGVLEAADKHPGDVYFYYFDYLGVPTSGPSDPSLAFGAAHTDEVFYIWKRGFLSYNLTEEQEEFSKKMVKVWTDFAKYGKAISPTNQLDWEKWSRERHNFMYISNQGFFLKEKLLEDRNEFWKSLNYKDKYE